MNKKRVNLQKNNHIYEMIESLSVTNFYCFKERTTILFTAKKERNRILDNEFCGFSTKNKINILKLIYLLGNNGSGKSKMLSAFDALQYLIGNIRERDDELLRHKPFAFDEDCLNKPSIIEIIYHIDDRRFSYMIEWDRNAIHKEYLKEIKGKNEIDLFYRWYDEANELAKVDFMSKMQISDDEAYIIKTTLLRNNSLLSVIAKTNISHPLLKSHFLFLTKGFEIIDLGDVDLNEELPDEKTGYDKQLKTIICSFLKSVDTNIMSYEKLKIDVNYPQELLQKLKSLPEKEQAELRMWLKMDEDKHIINTFHRLDNNIGNNRRGRLPLSEQSEGTKEILRLLLVLNDAIKNKRTIIIDDYSSGIQRDTLNQILKFFIGASQDSQLIISTQDYSLLDFDIIRRDAIRFLVKDAAAEAHVDSINLSLLHKNSSLRHYVSKMNLYKQLPEMNNDLFCKLLDLYKSL